METYHQKPVMIRVTEKIKESHSFATLYFDHSLDFTPGQFIMLWIPGMDEKPYTVSFHSKSRFGITIEAKGLFSQKAITLEKDDLVGIRGPFGKGFTIDSSQNIGVVAGGCGMAPLAPLVESLHQNILFIHGARTKEFILYPDRFKQKRHFCTDDGSMGFKGFVTDLLDEELSEGVHLDMVYTCGPEIMMYNVFQICEKHGIPCQVSLERYMRCGFGVCGACVCSDQLVCQDGPVFSTEKIRTMKDFNQSALLKSGAHVELEDYFSWRCQ